MQSAGDQPEKSLKVDLPKGKRVNQKGITLMLIITANRQYLTTLENFTLSDQSIIPKA